MKGHVAMMKNSKKIQQKDKDKNIKGRNESLSSALRNDIKTGAEKLIAAEKSIGSQEIPVPEKIRMLVSIVERGHGKTLIEWFGKNGVTYHYRCHGHGTASSDMMDILGLGSSEKDIVISFGTESTIAKLAWMLGDSLGNVLRCRGITMLLSPSAMSSMIAVMLTAKNNRTTHQSPAGESGSNNTEKESEEKMADIRSEHKHSLILIAVNQGYTEQVMQTARTAGATGGTVIRARLSDANQSEEFYGIALQAEKEIIAIMASDTVRNAIMDAVNAEHGMRSEAQAAICSLPVDRAFKI